MLLQELSAQCRQNALATDTLRKISNAVRAFVRDPCAASSLIGRVRSSASSKQHAAEAASRAALGEAAAGYAVLRVQHDCQTAAAAAAVYARLAPMSRIEVEDQSLVNMDTASVCQAGYKDVETILAAPRGAAAGARAPDHFRAGGSAVPETLESGSGTEPVSYTHLTLPTKA